MPLISPQLWLVATPLGNLGDFSPRAKEILASVDLVLAEDTRRAGILFKNSGFEVTKLWSFHEHNELAKLKAVIRELKNNKTVALISDAGMPLLADPGYRLVKACRDEGIKISVVPGPSAILTALAASGIAPYPFCFLGFLPRKSKEQSDIFRKFLNIPATLVFFERKDRLTQTLDIAYQVFGDRELCIGRELTKEYEEFIYTKLSDQSLKTREFLGEVTVVIGPKSSQLITSESVVLDLIQEYSDTALKLKEMAKKIQVKTEGWSAKAIYQLILLKAN